MTRAAALLAALIVAALAWLGPARAQTDFAAVVIEDAINVTSDFRGARITTFGAVSTRRGGDVVVVVRGPGAPVQVMRKRPLAGLWINADPVVFENAPSFFAVLSARPLTDIASTRAIWEMGLDPAGAARLSGPTPADADPAAYRAALVRLKRAQGLYLERPRGLALQDGLYIAHVDLPANAPLGEYRVDHYLFRDGRLTASKTSTVPVTRVGVERRIHDVAMRLPVLYGLGVVALALGAGWAAAAIFRRL